jgi:hypothetical protein
MKNVTLEYGIFVVLIPFRSSIQMGKLTIILVNLSIEITTIFYYDFSSLSVIYDVAILGSKYDMFVIAGKRLVYYENDMYADRGKNNTEEVVPLSLDFNTYYN